MIAIGSVQRQQGEWESERVREERKRYVGRKEREGDVKLEEARKVRM